MTDKGNIDSVYEWSSHQTSESCKFDVNEYYWTDPVKTALYRLQNTEKVLIGIQGLQGTGKSAALSALMESLPSEKITIMYKWSREWKKQFLENEIPLEDDYWLALWRRLLSTPDVVENKLHIASDVIRHDLNTWKTASDTVSIEQYVKDTQIQDSDEFVSHMPKSDKQRIKERLDCIADSETLEKLLGPRVVEEIRENLLYNFMAKVSYVFIDMPDYNKTNLQLMNKDIDELQHMWDEFMERGRKTNFLIAVQKEIVMKKPHFFFGKIRWLDLQPLMPEQLLEAYLQKWKTTEPFTEDALRLIAKLSRGVFRRFLNYINNTIETFQMSGKSGSVTSEYVKKTVSFDVLLRDLELELSDIFSNSQQRIQAVGILNILREKTLTQKQIAENLDISEATSGKLVAKLELYNYVKRTRSKEGSGWIVSLA